MQKYISNTDTSDIRFFEEDVTVSDWIDLDEYRLMTEDEIERLLNPQNFLTEEEKRIEFLNTLKPLTRRQFKLGLLENDLLERVESTIDNIPDLSLRRRMQIEYAESIEFQRQSESVIAMCEMLELTENQVDQLWQQAMAL
ncbi:hypothetical protein [Acinetobacter bereziniae]|uniref:hypothetical protein n=1 Tax=Acinetobacter bereziniae TaxID=106648 RepID=UPI00124CFD93|nr:hypothetical protein [Acinetobacter bereziniae]